MNKQILKFIHIGPIYIQLMPLNIWGVHDRRFGPMSDLKLFNLR